MVGVAFFRGRPTDAQLLLFRRAGHPSVGASRTSRGASSLLAARVRAASTADESSVGVLDDRRRLRGGGGGCLSSLRATDLPPSPSARSPRHPEEARREFERPPPANEATRARAMARSLVALTWLRRASANPKSTEGEILYQPMGQRDSWCDGERLSRSSRKRRDREASGAGVAELELMRAAYGPLADLIGVRGVAGEYWSPE